jgi:hypothetical protein
MEDDNKYSIRLIQGMWSIYKKEGGNIPEDLKGLFTEEHRAVKAIRDYYAKQVLESYPVRSTAILKDPKRPGRKPKGIKNGTSKTDSAI